MSYSTLYPVSHQSTHSLLSDITVIYNQIHGFVKLNDDMLILRRFLQEYGGVLIACSGPSVTKHRYLIPMH